MNREEELKVTLHGVFEELCSLDGREEAATRDLREGRSQLMKGLNELLQVLTSVSKAGPEEVEGLSRMLQAVKSGQPESLDLRDLGGVLKSARILTRQRLNAEPPRGRGARSGIRDDVDKRVASLVTRGLDGFLGTVAQLGWVEREDDAIILAAHAGRNMGMLVVSTKEQQDRLYAALGRERSVVSLQNANIYPWPRALHASLNVSPADLRDKYGNPQFLVELIQVAEPFRPVSDGVKRVLQTVFAKNLLCDSRAQGEAYRLFLLSHRIPVPQILCRDGAIIYSDGVHRAIGERPDSLNLRPIGEQEAFFGAPPAPAADSSGHQTLLKRMEKDPTSTLAKLQDACRASAQALSGCKEERGQVEARAKEVLIQLRDLNASAWAGVDVKKALAQYKATRNQPPTSSSQQGQEGRRGSLRAPMQPENGRRSSANGEAQQADGANGGLNGSGNGKKRRRSSNGEGPASPDKPQQTRKPRVGT